MQNRLKLIQNHHHTKDAKIIFPRYSCIKAVNQDTAKSSGHPAPPTSLLYHKSFSDAVLTGAAKCSVKCMLSIK